LEVIFKNNSFKLEFSGQLSEAVLKYYGLNSLQQISLYLDLY
jgi:hypothetical protein